MLGTNFALSIDMENSVRTTILILVAVFLGNIAFAGANKSNCPLRTGGNIQTKKPAAHGNLLPSAEVKTLKPRSTPSTDTENER